MEMILHSHLLLPCIRCVNCHERSRRREERAIGHAGRAHVRDVGHADVIRDAKRSLFGVSDTWRALKQKIQTQKLERRGVA